MTWLQDVTDDPFVEVVSDQEHRSLWNIAHKLRRAVDEMTAQRLAREYSRQQLHVMIDGAAFGTDPYREDVLRRCWMALKIQKSLQSSERLSCFHSSMASEPAAREPGQGNPVQYPCDSEPAA